MGADEGQPAQLSGDKGAGTNGAANKWRQAQTGASEHERGWTAVAPPPPPPAAAAAAARAATGAGVLHVLPLPRFFFPFI